MTCRLCGAECLCVTSPTDVYHQWMCTACGEQWAGWPLSPTERSLFRRRAVLTRMGLRRRGAQYGQ